MERQKVARVKQKSRQLFKLLQKSISRNEIQGQSKTASWIEKTNNSHNPKGYSRNLMRHR